MANNVLVNNTVRVQVTFRDWSESGEGAILDPTTVTVDIMDSDMVRTPAVEEPVKVADGIYRYDWTPTEAGKFFVEFTGAFPGGVSTLVREEFNVTITPGESTADGETLGEDYVLEFATELDPLYIDPEELHSVYPDASLMEIYEAIHRYSVEVYTFFQGTPNFQALEYIRAAALCSLSRVYDADMAGLELALGDLRIADSRSSKASSPASNVCELAALLRRQVARVGMISVVRGGMYVNPMPTRVLPYHKREIDRGNPRA